MEIGFIGLGNMGREMAANLVHADHRVTVFNRSLDKATALVEQGAFAAHTVADACTGQVVFTMLADDAAVEAVTWGEHGILATLAPNAVHVSCSTISVDLAHRLDAAHAEAGQHFVSAPVFGRPEAAAAAALFVVTAGDTETVQKLLPLFDVIGKRTFVIGERPESANLVKLSGNFLLAAAIEALSEAIALVGTAGIDRQQYVDIMTSTLFSAPAYQTYGRLIAHREFEPAGFAARLGLKDVKLALAAGEHLGVPLPTASLLRDRLLTLVATGGGELDWSAVSTLAERDAGSTQAGNSGAVSGR